MSYPNVDSWTDLADDCREVSGVLAPFVVDLTNIPTPRAPYVIDLTSSMDTAAASLEGYAEYGS